MMNLVIVFGLLAIAMLVSCRVIDFMIARFNLALNKDRVDSTITQGINYPSSFDLGTYHHTAPVVNNCDLEAFCGEVIENAEGIGEGLSAITNLAGEHIATFIEGI